VACPSTNYVRILYVANFLFICFLMQAGLRATCADSLKSIRTNYNYLIYLPTYNLYDSLIRWMWRLRTGTTRANKMKTMNIIGVKVGGKVLPEDVD